MTKPFYNSLIGLKQNMTNITKSFKVIKTLVEPISNELGMVNDSNTRTLIKRNLDTNEQRVQEAIKQQNIYIEKIEKRCKLQMSKGISRCKNAFNEAFEKCHDRLPFLISTILCWPIKITIVCKVGEIFGTDRNICDPSSVIDPELGTNYVKLKNIMSNFSEVKLTYKTIQSSQIDDVKRLQRLIFYYKLTKHTLFSIYLFL